MPEHDWDLDLKPLTGAWPAHQANNDSARITAVGNELAKRMAQTISPCTQEAIDTGRIPKP